MKFVCERCQTRYSIADEKVRQKILKIRCKTCENVITVREQPAAAPAPPPPAPRAAVAEWYVAIDGHQAGPLGRADLVKRLAMVKSSEESYVWKEDFDSWKEPKDVPGLLQEVNALKGRTSLPPPAPSRTSMPPLPATKGGTGKAAVLPGPRPATAGPRATAPRPSVVAQPLMASGASAAVVARPAPVEEERFEEDERTQIQPLDASLLAGDLAGKPAPAPAPLAGLGGTGSIPPLNGVPAAAATGATAATGSMSALFDDPMHAAVPAGAPGAGAFFPPPAAQAPQPARADDGLSRLTGLPGVMSRTPAIKFVAAGAVVVVLLVVAIFALVSRPTEPPRAVAAPTPARPVVLEDPERKAREEAEARFKATVPDTTPEPPRSVGRAERRPVRPAPRNAPLAPPPAIAPPALEPSPLGSGGPSRVAEGERQVRPVAPSARPAGAGGGREVDQGQISAVVRRKDHQDAIKSCYERALKRDDRLRSGRIDVTAEVGSSGLVKSVVLNAPPEFSTVEPCIKSSIKRWAFPAAQEGYNITFPLILQGNI